MAIEVCVLCFDPSFGTGEHEVVEPCPFYSQRRTSDRKKSKGKEDEVGGIDCFGRQLMLIHVSFTINLV